MATAVGAQKKVAISANLVPKEPSFPPPKRLRMQELTIREAETIAATLSENFLDEHTLVLSLKENMDDTMMQTILENVQGFYHLIGRGNGKPIWKSEEGGTALGRFSLVSVA